MEAGKELLKEKAQEIIQGLPVYSRTDFENLISILVGHEGNEQERKTVYQTWITILFQRSRETYTCTFCGNPAQPSGEGTRESFCSDECRDTWKRDLMVILSAYM